MNPAALLLAIHAVTGPTRPPAHGPERINATRMAAPFVLDGSLGDPAWRTAQAITGLLQRQPDEGARATMKTEIRVMYDDAALYISARMYDSAPDSIIARLGRRDSDPGSDLVAIYLDPFHDGRTGFFFGVDAAGTLYDGTLYNDDWDDATWDGVWEAKSARDSLGWTAEFRIPFSQLRFQAAPSLTWGINVQRYVARRNERDYLAYTPKNGSGFVSRFPELVGLEGVTPPRRLELLPYTTMKAEYAPHAAGDPFNDGSSYSSTVGGDVKFGIGGNLTVDATVNPDFGQVEVDPAVVNLSDFETFYDEKRPFFVEGADIFDNFGRGGANDFWGFNWGNPAFFYSRRIGRTPQGSLPGSDFSRAPSATSILGAAKLSGRYRNGWSVGAVQAVTQREFADVMTAGSRSQVEVEPLTYYGVARASKEFSGRSAVGFLSTLTQRDFADDALRSQVNRRSFNFGVDGWSFLDHDKGWVVTGWAGLSRNEGTPERMIAIQESSIHYMQRPDSRHLHVDRTATSLTGLGGRVSVNKQKGNWKFNGALGVISPSMDVTDLGFQFRSDIVNASLVSGYEWTRPTSLYQNLSTYAAVFRSSNFDGDVTWHGVFTRADMELRNFWDLRGQFAWNPRSIDTRLTRGGPASINNPGWESQLSFESNNRHAWSFGGHVARSHYGNGESSSWMLGTSVDWKPSSRISVSLEPEYEHSRVGAQYVGTYDDTYATATFGHRYVFGGLDQKTLSASLRLNYIATPRLSLQLYAQPLVSSGDYAGFKELAAPRTYDFTVYGQDGVSTFDPSTGMADPDGPGGPAAPINVGNPDFTFVSLRGNAVIRWEYLPGSTMYLVWTQNRSATEDIGEFGLRRSLGALFDQQADNTFLLKVSYWWNPR